MASMSSVRLRAALICAFVPMAHAIAAQPSIPDFSSGDFPWVTRNAEYLPPASGLGPLTIDKSHSVTVPIANNRGEAVATQLRVADLSNPNLKPWVVDHLKKANEDLLAGKTRYSAPASCKPGGVPDFLVYAGAFQPIYVLPTQGKIVLINQGNTEVRHIYLDVPHSANPKPSWYGESVGRYENGELVVDTIGFNDKTFVDESFNLPHTAQLHVVERFKLTDDGKGLEIGFTIEDPGAFNAPWSGVVRYRRTANEDLLEEQPCADQNVSGGGFHNQFFDVPVAEKPYF